MNRIEVLQFIETFFEGLKNSSPSPQTAAAVLKPFLDLLLTLKQDLPVAIPLLKCLAALDTEKPGPLKNRIDRRYYRLCRIQEELGRLDLKKASPGASGGFALEDYVFSQIDFSRYREMEKDVFEKLYLEGLEDFSDDFFVKNFGIGRAEIQSAIEASYKIQGEHYKLQKENPLILSVMRTLETSLESSPLFTAREIQTELKSLLDFVNGGKSRGKAEQLPGMGLLYPFLIHMLDNAIINHDDGMQTRLFISPQGDLSATFRPGGKPWTMVLIGKQ